MVSFLSVSLYGLAAAAGFAGALPGLPKRIHERQAGSTSDSNVVGYETETRVVTRTIYKSTSGYVSPTSSGASYYTSTVTINGMQYTMCVAPKLLSKNTTDLFDTYAKQLQLCSSVLLPEEFYWQFIACCFNSLRFSKHTYGNEDSTGVKLHSFLRQPEYSVE
ncbi:hypothetical protein KC318_g14014 [Hortaea werneckii]|nr:hypothetical protein KC334_g13922 [Hortaea werneckii]KAI7014944.1 hypothetical protein KC355_g4508 [Hortaea werneckii]KAI7653776.1 hypothetical protein KC318_g14014 [Hortaea werneckii]